MTLQINELRIGNLLRVRLGDDYHKFSHERNPICTVDGIFDDDEKPDLEFLELHGYYEANFFNCAEGILLDSEWLLRFGFVFNGCGYVFHKFELNIYNDEFYISNKFITRLRYVHQLQNLYFALTGAELKLKGELNEKE